MNDTMIKEKIGVAMARRLEYANAPLPGLGKRRQRYFFVTMQLFPDEFKQCERAAKAAGCYSVSLFVERAVKDAVKNMTAQIQYLEMEQELARARKAGFKV